MEKYIDATQSRPHGERLIDAETSLININEYVAQIKAEEAWLKNDRNGLTLFKGDNVSIILLAMHTGARMRSHIPEGIMSLQLLYGKLQFTTDTENFDMEKDEMVMLHKSKVYNIDVIEEAVLLITMAIL
jgi:hypothetical protein